MQANLARSLAGGGKQSENWELIEEVSGITGFSSGSGGNYNRNFTAEPNGTPYNFKAIAVYVYANTKDTNQHQIEKPTASSAMTSVAFGSSCDPREQGTGYVSVLRIKDGALYDKNNCGIYIASTTSNPVPALPEDDPITGVTLTYRKGSGGPYEPYHVKWRIYAVRA